MTAINFGWGNKGSLITAKEGQESVEVPFEMLEAVFSFLDGKTLRAVMEIPGVFADAAARVVEKRANSILKLARPIFTELGEKGQPMQLAFTEVTRCKILSMSIGDMAKGIPTGIKVYYKGPTDSPIQKLTSDCFALTTVASKIQGIENDPHEIDLRHITRQLVRIRKIGNDDPSLSAYLFHDNIQYALQVCELMRPDAALRAIRDLIPRCWQRSPMLGETSSPETQHWLSSKEDLKAAHKLLTDNHRRCIDEILFQCIQGDIAKIENRIRELESGDDLP